MALPATYPTIDISTKSKGDVTIYMVKGSSDIHKLGGAILKSARDGEIVHARAVGAGAVNQAGKGCAIARDMGLKEGLDLTFGLEFATITMGGVERSALSFVLHIAHL
jgi:stage V sporulation protein SpoVS